MWSYGMVRVTCAAPEIPNRATSREQASDRVFMATDSNQYVGGAATYALTVLSWPSASTAATPNTQSSIFA